MPNKPNPRSRSIAEPALSPNGAKAEHARRATVRPSPRPKVVIPRVGHGYDVHRFCGKNGVCCPDHRPNKCTRTLVIGGVEFPGHPALISYTDGDVVLHAVIDAMIGAANLGDIGSHFRSDDPKWKGASSLTMLEHAGNMLAHEGLVVDYVDTTVVAEQPRLQPQVPEMRCRIAGRLQIDADRVSVKPRSHEGIGTFGRGEGIGAFAVVSVVSLEE
ncbi:MAG: 2-C-methyl-D-erythritol 2,4-cyclodiphosphate synthase [Dehalococcoidia bacterium]